MNVRSPKGANIGSIPSNGLLVAATEDPTESDMCCLAKGAQISLVRMDYMIYELVPFLHDSCSAARQSALGPFLSFMIA